MSLHPMLTRALLEACRRNARNSHGPRIPLGKANVRMNALKGGAQSYFGTFSIDLAWRLFFGRAFDELNAQWPIGGISPEVIEKKGSNFVIGWWKRQK